MWRILVLLTGNLWVLILAILAVILLICISSWQAWVIMGVFFVIYLLANRDSKDPNVVKARRERRMVEKVIIPSVVFVRMEKQDRIIVERMMNVSCLMRDPARKGARSKGQDEYACISEDEIHLFRQMLEQEETDVNFTTTDFTIGEYVRIKDFPEGNNIAQIVRIYNDNKTYVGLRVSFLGCAYMQVPLNRIIKIDKS